MLSSAITQQTQRKRVTLKKFNLSTIYQTVFSLVCLIVLFNRHTIYVYSKLTWMASIQQASSCRVSVAISTHICSNIIARAPPLFALLLYLCTFTSDTPSAPQLNNRNGMLVITVTYSTYVLQCRHLPSKLNVFWHDGDVLCVNVAQVGILKQYFGISSHFSGPGQSLSPNVGMAPCESKGQPTSGISGSLKAVRKSKVQMCIRV